MSLTLKLNSTKSVSLRFCFLFFVFFFGGGGSVLLRPHSEFFSRGKSFLVPQGNKNRLH